jgi:bifunctional DNA primase/polymerase-like protein/primase-like protein
MAVNHTIKALSVECTAAGKMAVEGVFGKAPLVFKNGAEFCLNYKPKTSTTAKLEVVCKLLIKLVGVIAARAHIPHIDARLWQTVEENLSDPVDLDVAFEVLNGNESLSELLKQIEFPNEDAANDNAEEFAHLGTVDPAFAHLRKWPSPHSLEIEPPQDGANVAVHDPEHPILAAALAYAARGWDVFPADISLDEKTGKFRKKSYKSAKHSGGAKWGKTRDPEQIRRDFHRFPDANVGIVTGSESGIWDTETDTPEGHDVDGEASLRALEAEHGPLPDTLMAESPSGSKHRIFNYPKRVEIRNSTSAIGPGIDVRGEGGMFIAPPSVRKDGKYRWLNDNPIADAPQWLINLAVATAKKGNSKLGTVDPAFAHLDPDERLGKGIDVTAPIERIRAAFAVIPNNDLNWEDWNTHGMALYRATAGSDEGLEIFHAWSRKSKKKYNEQVTTDRWAAYKSCPPDRIGAGSIFHWANEASPGWERLNEDEREILRTFIRTALREGIDENTIVRACLDEKYRDRATYKHVRDNGGEDYVKQQIEHILNYDSLIAQPVPDAGVKLKDFYAYMPMHNYIFAPAREPWPIASVNARIPPVTVGVNKIKASTWIDQNQPVEMMTWAPGMPMIIADRLIAEGGWIERKGVSCFNLYRPPMIELGDASRAKPWVDLVHKVFPADADHIIKWFACRVQHPEIKINHGLFMGGLPGIGKDTIIEAAKRAVGSWNFKEIAPKNIDDDFNPWKRAVILRVNEAKDMGEVSRFELYDAMLTLLAAPPDVLECNEKWIKQHYVLNCVGVVITSNHLTDGIYLPPDDRRHYVAWSECKPAARKTRPCQRRTPLSFRQIAPSRRCLPSDNEQSRSVVG